MLPSLLLLMGPLIDGPTRTSLESCSSNVKQERGDNETAMNSADGLLIVSRMQSVEANINLKPNKNNTSNHKPSVSSHTHFTHPFKLSARSKAVQNKKGTVTHRSPSALRPAGLHGEEGGTGWTVVGRPRIMAGCEIVMKGVLLDDSRLRASERRVCYEYRCTVGDPIKSCLQENSSPQL
ncbi:hypothetical protein EYF80_020362 [Liparis tanakae]|uniref:Uncharacterized protein n=1 Tax=Liparis tanakae TaxID=230148 RepID=A0A4Z2HUW7_9TELE|nr:hypothetical protein EYF80_020362 [Liparis tanakae]